MNFDRDGDLTTGVKHTECIFLNFSRLLSKDEMKKETFVMSFATGANVANIPEFHSLKTVGDYSASNNYRVNSPAGEYGVLYTASTPPNADGTSGVGLVYYQAGVVLITGSLFDSKFGPPAVADFQTGSFDMMLTGAQISASCDGFRHRLNKIEFDNTTELNSTIYFCRANHSDFNYSANPTYLTGSKIRVKGNKRKNEPVSYVTAIGLYSPSNELLAVAKVSEPLKKSPSTELTLRVRLDY